MKTRYDFYAVRFFADNVKNPTLENFDIENKENKDNVDKCKEIVENESIFLLLLKIQYKS